MAEAVGIFVELNMSEDQLKKFLKAKFEEATYGKKIGYYFAELLHNSITENGNIFLIHYDKKTTKCFIGWLQNYFHEPTIEQFAKVLTIINPLRDQSQDDYAIVSSTYPETYFAYHLTTDGVKRIETEQVPDAVSDLTMKRFWSFSAGDSFPEPAKALNKRNYFYKNFKNYYKKYLAHQEEIAKPQKITEATKEKPYLLFDNFYTFDGKVYQFNAITNKMLEVEGADPFTLRNVSGIIADKNTAYLSRLSKGSPPAFVNGRYNPASVWEFYPVPDVDGDSFQYVKERWDTIFWKDCNNVYINNGALRQLTKVAGADSETFEYIDFCYGKDEQTVYYYQNRLDIDVNNYQVNKNGFIYDENTIYHYQHKLPLDVASFKVVSYESSVNPFYGTFVLEDKNGIYTYNRNWEEPVLRPKG